MVYRTCLENRSAARHREFESHPLRMKKIVLISCVSRKLRKKAKAEDLYVSDLFRKNLAYAHSLKPDGIYILSAKHGLLSLGQRVEPYDQTLNTMRSAEVEMWAQKVLRQMRGKVGPADKVVFLAGERYRKHLLPHFAKAVVPMQGLGIGKQLAYLKGKIKHATKK